MGISEDELRENIEYDKKRIERDKAIWDQIIPEQIPSTYYSMGCDSRGIAIYNLLLGNKEEALKWFEKAAEYYLKSRGKGFGYKDGRPLMYLHALPVAIMSCNKELMKSYAEESAKLEFKRGESPPSFFYHFVLSISNMLLHHNAEAMVHIKKLEELEPTNYSHLKYYRGLGKACKGIVEEDAQILKQGIEEILKRHKSLIPSLGRTMDDALVCIPATALLLLAKDRGIEIKIESEYIPEVFGGLGKPKEVDDIDFGNLRPNEILFENIGQKLPTPFFTVAKYKKLKRNNWRNIAGGFLNYSISDNDYSTTKRVNIGKEGDINKFNIALRLKQGGKYIVIFFDHKNSKNLCFFVLIEIKNGKILRRIEVEKEAAETPREFVEDLEVQRELAKEIEEAAPGFVLTQSDRWNLLKSLRI